MQVFDVPANDFINRRHRISVKSETADRDVVAVMDVTSDSSGKVHDFVLTCIHRNGVNF